MCVRGRCACVRARSDRRWRRLNLNESRDDKIAFHFPDQPDTTAIMKMVFVFFFIIFIFFYQQCFPREKEKIHRYSVVVSGGRTVQRWSPMNDTTSEAHRPYVLMIPIVFLASDVPYTDRQSTLVYRKTVFISFPTNIRNEQTSSWVTGEPPDWSNSLLFNWLILTGKLSYRLSSHKAA